MYTIYIHAVKGACGNIGADELAEFAKMLELAGKRGDLSYVHAHNSSFLQELEVFLNNINDLIKKYPSENQNSVSNLVLLSTWLPVLRKALSTLDSAVIKTATGELHKLIKTEDCGTIVKTILNYVLIGGYDDAIALIDSLLQRIKDVKI